MTENSLFPYLNIVIFYTQMSSSSYTPLRSHQIIQIKIYMSMGVYYIFMNKYRYKGIDIS